MKKQLVKKVKNTQRAIHYFSSENLSTAITTTTVDGRCYMVVSVSTSSCPC